LTLNAFGTLPARESTTSKVPGRTSREGVKRMLVAIPTGLLGGLLSGLQAQSEISELLEEFYYDGLS
jgi:hypothetical protein